MNCSEQTTQHQTSEQGQKVCNIYNTGALRTSPTKALFAMLNWLPTVRRAKQTAKFAAIRLNVLPRWRIVPSGHSTFLEVAPVNIDYLPADFCLDRGFHFFNSE